MEQAYEEALKALEKGEVPVGAVIVLNDEVIGRGHNQVESLRDPTAHAEILAIRDATKKVQNWRLNEAKMYVTVEPCIMCSGASVLARLQEVVYGVEDPKFGGTVSLFEIPADERLNHRVIVRKGPLSNEIRDLMRSFFKRRREEGK